MAHHQARLIALVAASGNRSAGGRSSSSGRKKSGGGTAAATSAGVVPQAFGADRIAAAPALVTIDADDLYAVFDPDGWAQQAMDGQRGITGKAGYAIRLNFETAKRHVFGVGTLVVRCQEVFIRCRWGGGRLALSWVFRAANRNATRGSGRFVLRSCHSPC